MRMGLIRDAPYQPDLSSNQYGGFLTGLRFTDVTTFRQHSVCAPFSSYWGTTTAGGKMVLTSGRLATSSIRSMGRLT
jgi:hypothetical protein